MEKMIWVLILIVALVASFVPLEPFALSLAVFVLFVLVCTALHQKFSTGGHWVDRVSPLVVVGLGLAAFVAYFALFVAWGNSSLDFQVWRVIPQLLFMYVGMYVFVLTGSGFMAGATRQKPSRFFQPFLVISVICYGAMLLLTFQ